MASSTKPALVFVTGSFVMAPHYEPLMESVRAKGYSAQAVQLRSAGKRPGPLPTMYDDAEDINAVLTKLADEGKDVVITAHSYGGIPTSQSLKGVTKAEREKDGKKGGVVRVGYVSSLVPEIGVPAGGMLAAGSSEPTEPLVAPGEDGWMSHADKDRTIAAVFNSLSYEQGVEGFKDFVNHSAVSFGNELTHAGYKDVPASWFFCEDDKCVLPAVQQMGIDNIEKASGRKVDVTRNFSDHCPELSTPENLTNWLVGLLEKGGE